VLACSALKRTYRDFLQHGRPSVKIVMLEVDQATLMARLAERHGHFFPVKLLQSQLADLEMPVPAEHVLVVPASGTPAEMADKIITELGLGPQPPGTSGRPASG
jgi:gluconokinase